MSDKKPMGTTGELAEEVTSCVFLALDRDCEWIIGRDDTVKKVAKLLKAYAQSELAAAQAENERLRAENERLILQYTIAECWWEDGDTRYDSPEEYADEQSLAVGAEFELTASTYWQEKYRVTKVRSETDDDFECEQISKQREEFVTYQEMKTRLQAAESELSALRSVEKK